MSSVTDFHKAIGHEVISVDTLTFKTIKTTATVSGVTTEATKVTFTVLNADIRYRFDGTAPTSTTGHYLGAGLVRELFGHENLDQLKLIAVSGTAEVTVTIEAPESS
jgi:hypothetical protein